MMHPNASFTAGMMDSPSHHPHPHHRLDATVVVVVETASSLPTTTAARSIDNADDRESSGLAQPSSPVGSDASRPIHGSGSGGGGGGFRGVGEAIIVGRTSSDGYGYGGALQSPPPPPGDVSPTKSMHEILEGRRAELEELRRKSLAKNRRRAMKDADDLNLKQMTEEQLRIEHYRLSHQFQLPSSPSKSAATPEQRSSAASLLPARYHSEGLLSEAELFYLSNGAKEAELRRRVRDDRERLHRGPTGGSYDPGGAAGEGGEGSSAAAVVGCAMEAGRRRGRPQDGSPPRAGSSSRAGPVDDGGASSAGAASVSVGIVSASSSGFGSGSGLGSGSDVGTTTDYASSAYASSPRGGLLGYAGLLGFSATTDDSGSSAIYSSYSRSTSSGSARRVRVEETFSDNDRSIMSASASASASVSDGVDGAGEEEKEIESEDVAEEGGEEGMEIVLVPTDASDDTCDDDADGDGDADDEEEEEKQQDNDGGEQHHRREAGAAAAAQDGGGGDDGLAASEQRSALEDEIRNKLEGAFVSEDRRRDEEEAPAPPRPGPAAAATTAATKGAAADDDDDDDDDDSFGRKIMAAMRHAALGELRRIEVEAREKKASSSSSASKRKERGEGCATKKRGKLEDKEEGEGATTAPADLEGRATEAASTRAGKKGTTRAEKCTRMDEVSKRMAGLMAKTTVEQKKSRGNGVSTTKIPRYERTSISKVKMTSTPTRTRREFAATKASSPNRMQPAPAPGKRVSPGIRRRRDVTSLTVTTSISASPYPISPSSRKQGSSSVASPRPSSLSMSSPRNNRPVTPLSSSLAFGKARSPAKRDRPSPAKHVCSRQFEPRLHRTRGPCDRCLHLADDAERKEFESNGRHLRIALTRGGCRSRACPCSPRAQRDGGRPVRLCGKCFQATHAI